MSSPLPSDVAASDAAAADAAAADAPAPDEVRDRVGASVRALSDALVRTGATDADLADIAAELDRLSVRLAADPHAGYLQDSPFHPLSMVGGTAHPSAPQVQVSRTADGVEGTVTLGPAHEGGPGLVHGGVISLIFDHLMGQAVYVRGHSAMTGSLQVRYRRPTPLDVPLAVSASVDRVDGRRIFVSASMRHDGVVTADAEGLFVQLTADNVARIFTSGRIPDGPPPGSPSAGWSGSEQRAPGSPSVG